MKYEKVSVKRWRPYPCHHVIDSLEDLQTVQLIIPVKIVDPAHKVVTYVEYTAVSASSKILTPHPPLHPASVSSSRTKGGGGGGGYTVAGRWGVNILEDARHWIGLLQYNLSTILQKKYSKIINAISERSLSL